jgi:hypothetical protein
MDSHDHLMPDDLRQSATIVAAFVYNAAMQDEKIPGKELPTPLPVDPTTGSKRWHSFLLLNNFKNATCIRLFSLCV